MYTIKFENDIELNHKENESFSVLRTNIAFCGADVKTIVMTSCLPNEGKSTTTFQIAKAFALAGKKVLLIDADMRKSVFHSRFGMVGKHVGLSHYLSGIAKYDEVIGIYKFQEQQGYHAQLESKASYELHMILAGAVPPNPSELLETPLFADLLCKVREEYDYVFIDTPPVGAVIDAAIVSRISDGVVLVLKNGYVSYRLAQKVIRQLRLSKCRILGAIYTIVPISSGKSGGYRKGYYGGYYSGYYGSYYGADRGDKK